MGAKTRSVRSGQGGRKLAPSVSLELEHLLRLSGGKGLSFREIAKDLDFRGHALMAIVLSLPFLLPMPLPGLSTPIGFLLVVVGFAIAIQIPPWLPLGLSEKRLPHHKLEMFVTKALPWVKRLERVLRPRLLILSAHPKAVRVHGLVIAFAAFLLALPAPPGGNIAPASAIVSISLGLLEEDGLFIALGYLLLAVSLVILVTIFSVLVIWFQSLTAWF